MPRFTLRRLFQSVSLFALDCGLGVLLSRIEEAYLGFWALVPVLVILFLLGAAGGTLFGRTRAGGILALLVTFPLLLMVLRLGDSAHARPVAGDSFSSLENAAK